MPTPAPNGGATSVADQAPPEATKFAGVRSIEEATPAKDPSDTIMEVADAVLRAATARIAYHENHAKRLREMCASFSAIGRPAVASGVPAGDDVKQTLKDLLTIAASLKTEEGFP